MVDTVEGIQKAISRTETGIKIDRDGRTINLYRVSRGRSEFGHREVYESLQIGLGSKHKCSVKSLRVLIDRPGRVLE